ncbi:MAG: NAD-binding protein, partial [Fidelibacterota bacterium]
MSLKIIIVGAGEVGYHLASMLSLENHDIVMIESNPEKCRRVKENLDVFVVEGSGASAKVLLDAGTPNSDIIIAVTSIDEINIISCMLAGKLNVRKKIARVRNPEYAGSKPLISPMEFGIDMIIHPEDEAAKEIVRLVKRASASDLIEFENGKIQLLGFHVDSNSPILRVPLKEIGERYSRLTFRTVAITRGKETIIPSGEDYLMDGDRVLIV